MGRHSFPMAWNRIVKGGKSVADELDKSSWRHPHPNMSPVNEFSNAFKQKQTRLHPWDVDDNRAILRHIHLETPRHSDVIDLIKKRMAEGAKKYGHGMRVADDTRQYKSTRDSWVEHALQENLDGIVYMASALERLRRDADAGTMRVEAHRNALAHQVLACRELLFLLGHE